MPDLEPLEVLKLGVEAWNKWRKGNIERRLDLRGAEFSQTRHPGIDLMYADLTGVDFSYADLTSARFDFSTLTNANFANAYLTGAQFWATQLKEANLSGAKLGQANLGASYLGGANFCEANLVLANLNRVRLIGADLAGARLDEATLIDADLTGASMKNVSLLKANFTRATLSESDFAGAVLGFTTFNSTDLSKVKNLETVRHVGPSIISIDTLYRSGGDIPSVFLRGCGTPDEFITFLPSIIGAQQAIQFYSCFISYSSHDDEFARRLYSRMRDEGLRVWFAPEDVKGGQKLHEQIYDAIQLHDRLLLALSRHSMRSEWVVTEIRRARKVEEDEKRRKLFPIRLLDFDTIRKWECFDADTGKDLAIELREYYMPDFSNWKDHDSFEREFAKLYHALRAVE